jgi:flagellar hook-basal body protein
LNPPPHTQAVVFSNSSGSANGLDGNTSFELTRGTERAVESTDLRNLVNSSISDGKTIEITGRNPDGSFVQGTFTYGKTGDGTTVQDLLDKINKTFSGKTATLSNTGQIVVTNNAPGNSLSSISLSDGTAIGFKMVFDTEFFSSDKRYLPPLSGGDIGTVNINSLRTNGLNPQAVSSSPYQDGDEIHIFATQLDGATKKVTFTFGDRTDGYDGTTLNDLINRINNSNEFPGLIAYLQDGRIMFEDRSTMDIHDYTGIQILNGSRSIGRGLESTFGTTAGTNKSNIVVPTFTDIQKGETGRHHSAITVFDSSGQAHKVDIHYTQDVTPGSNKWFWEILINEGKLVPLTGGSGSVTFNDNGSIREFAYDNGTELRFLVPGGQEMRVKLNGGTPGDFNGMTSFNSPSTQALIEQDGYTMGVLSNININDQGIITGIYSNGISKALAQIALANFTNEGGLMKEGNSLFSANASSGPAILAWAGVNNNTALKSGYLEASNVDLTEEFAKLIISQRALEANAKVINTADMVLSTIIDRLKR